MSTLGFKEQAQEHNERLERGRLDEARRKEAQSPPLIVTGKQVA